MKVFKIEASGFSHEDDIAIIIVAEDEKRGLEIAKKGQPYDWKDPDKDDLYWEFKENQYPLIVEEIDVSVEHAVLVSNM